MCGRYVFKTDDKFYDRFEIKNRLKELNDNFNVAPGNQMPVITRNSPNKVQLMSWGLIPFWAKDKNIPYKTINARAENITQKASYKKPFYKTRCLIPASGFYEWRRQKGKKIPYYFHLKNKKIFSFAGLYDIWKDNKTTKRLQTFTIITCKANSLIANIHTRMPVILDKKDENTWLNKDISKKILLNLLKPFPVKQMSFYEVSMKVNSTQVNGKDLIEEYKNSLF